MPRSLDQHQPVLADRPAPEHGVVDRALDHAQFGLALADADRRLFGIGDGQVDRDLWVSSVKSGENRRQPVGGGRLAGHQAQRPARQAAHVVERLFGGAGPRQDIPRLLQEQAASIRQADAAPDPVEQMHAVAGFQRRNRRRSRRLRDVQHPGGGGHMLALGDGDEDAQLFKSHD